LNYFSTENPTLNCATIDLLSIKRLTPSIINSFVKTFKFIVKIYAKKLSKLVNQEVPKNKIGQKKRIFSFNTNPKQNKNNNNTYKKKKYTNKK